MHNNSYLPNCPNFSSLSPTQSPTNPPHEPQNGGEATSLDYDVVVILAAMICALLCALGLNSMLHCIVRCTRTALTQPVEWINHHRMNAGFKREDILALPVATFSMSSTEFSSQGCAVCLTDFNDGEKIRVLPECKHEFHVACIDTWLMSHCSCPTCRLILSRTNQTHYIDIAMDP